MVLTGRGVLLRGAIWADALLLVASGRSEPQVVGVLKDRRSGEIEGILKTLDLEGYASRELTRQDLQDAGVDTNFHSEKEQGITGKCLVLITPDAERSMNSYLALNDTLSVDQLDAQAIAESEWVYIEGYRVTSDTSREAAIRTREIAEESGVKTALSFSDPGMVEFFRDGMEQMVGEKLDLLFCNEAEAKGWAQTDDLDLAVERLKNTARSFAVTLGAEGALVFDGTELTSIPPHQVHALDSNGAGDMFAGAFLYAITRGEDFPTAGRFASLAAGKIVANYGPRLASQEYSALRAEFFGD